VTTLDSGSASGPQWSPDGRMILFFSDQNGTDDIYAVRLDDGAIIPIRNTEAEERWPTWGK
jgi:Tol biopolymer transport system component